MNKIVIDGKGRIPISSRFLRTEGRSIVITSEECGGEWYDGMRTVMEEEGLDLEILRINGTGHEMDLFEVMGQLRDLGITKLLVEGGSMIIYELVKNGLFDRFTIYFGPMLIGGSGPAIMGGDGLLSPFPVDLRRIEPTPDGGFLIEMVVDHQ
jgi:riboflavin biosynthesis pyrimidine reductase